MTRSSTITYIILALLGSISIIPTVSAAPASESSSLLLQKRVTCDANQGLVASTSGACVCDATRYFISDPTSDVNLKCKCPANKSPMNVRWQNNKWACVCNAGYYQIPADGQCVKCPTGTTTSEPGKNKCTCLPHRSLAPDKSGKCLCSPGYKTNVQTGQCEVCPPGLTSDLGSADCGIQVDIDS